MLPLTTPSQLVRLPRPRIIEDQRVKGSWGVYGVKNAQNIKGPTKRASFNAKRFLSPEGAANSIAVSANPVSLETDAYFNIWVGSIIGNNVDPMTFLVQIDSIVEFTDPENVTPS